MFEINRNLARKKRHKRIRKNIIGTKERPRLCVFRSLKHIYAQVIDDETGETLVSASTLNKEINSQLSYKGNIQAAQVLGELLVKKLQAAGINKVVFDRGGYLYHGRVKVFAESVRKGKIEF